MNACLHPSSHLASLLFFPSVPPPSMPRCSPLQQGKRWHVDTQWIANLHRERGVEGGGEVWGGGDWREVVWRIQTATIGFFFPTLKIRGGKELQRSITLNTGCVPPTQPTPLHTLLSLSPTTSPLSPLTHYLPLPSPHTYFQFRKRNQ